MQQNLLLPPRLIPRYAHNLRYVIYMFWSSLAGLPSL